MQRYTKIPYGWIIGGLQYLSGNAIKVALVLRAHRNGKTGACYPSEERMAQLLNCSLSTVKRAIRELEAKRFIAVERKPPRHNRYTFLDAFECITE